MRLVSADHLHRIHSCSWSVSPQTAISHPQKSGTLREKPQNLHGVPPFRRFFRGFRPLCQFASGLRALAYLTSRDRTRAETTTRGANMRVSDPALLTANQRSREVATILARGVRRLLRPAIPSEDATSHPSEKAEDSDQNFLELSDETRLSVHTGYRSQPPEKGEQTCR